MSPREMLLSVIIPVYNEELTIGNIIDRTKKAMQQIGFQYEIIVVGGGPAGFAANHFSSPL